MCQNVDDIALTKLDVLSEFETIPVITAYSIDGKVTKDFVTDSRLEKAKPVIEELPGWKCDISGCRNWEELPENAKKYILTLEKLISHKIHLVSTGAEREEYLLRD
jgi:adenylosuccinate synthase